MKTRYTVQVDGDYLVKFDVDGDYISSTFDIDGDEVSFDSIEEVEGFLAELLDAAEKVTERLEQPPRIRVKTATGKPSKSKKIVEAVEKTEQGINKAYEEAQRRREVDQEISRLMIEKIEREEDDEALIALLVA